MSDSLNEAQELIAAYRRDGDVGALDHAAGALASAEPDPAARGQVLDGWLALIAAISRDLDPGFDPEDKPMVSVSPPAEDGMRAPPGVDPSVIRDPDKRHEYVQAIEANRLKAERFAVQNQLLRISRNAVQDAATFVRNAYPAEADVAELQRAVAQAALPPEVSAQLLDR